MGSRGRTNRPEKDSQVIYDIASQLNEFIEDNRDGNSLAPDEIGKLLAQFALIELYKTMKSDLDKGTDEIEKNLAA